MEILNLQRRCEIQYICNIKNVYISKKCTLVLGAGLL